jgi:hypothetical protein
MGRIAHTQYTHPISVSFHLLFPEMLLNSVIKLNAALWKILGSATVLNISLSGAHFGYSFSFYFAWN